MKNFPVRIDLLSRFRTPSQQKNTLDGLKKGLVDIVIGTHRLLDVLHKVLLNLLQYPELPYKPLISSCAILEADIFGAEKKKRKKKTYEGQKIQNFTDLSIGDYVVHENLVPYKTSVCFGRIYPFSKR